MLRQRMRVLGFLVLLSACVAPVPLEVTCSPVTLVEPGMHPFFRFQRVVTTEAEYRALFTATTAALVGHPVEELPVAMNPAPFVDAELGLPGPERQPLVVAGGYRMDVSRDQLSVMPTQYRVEGPPRVGFGPGDAESTVRALVDALPFAAPAAGWTLRALPLIEGTTGPDGTPVHATSFSVFGDRLVRGVRVRSSGALFAEVAPDGSVRMARLSLLVPRLRGGVGDEVPCDALGALPLASREALQRRFEADVRGLTVKSGAVVTTLEGDFVYAERGDTGVFQPWFEASYRLDHPESSVVPRWSRWRLRGDGLGQPRW